MYVVKTTSKQILFNWKKKYVITTNKMAFNQGVYAPDLIIFWIESIFVLSCEKALTLASCLQIAVKDVWTWADSLNLITTHLEKNFRIQAINGILRPECVHQCLRSKTKCAAV